MLSYTFCKFGNFCENIIKRHICDVKNLRLWHDWPLSVNDSVISLFHKGLISKKNLKNNNSWTFPNLQYGKKHNVEIVFYHLNIVRKFCAAIVVSRKLHIFALIDIMGESFQD